MQCNALKKRSNQRERERLDKSCDSNSNIPGTRRFHFFKNIDENVIGLQTISADPYNCKFFDIKSGKFFTLPGISDEQETNVSHETELRQGDWVEVVYGREIYWSNN